MMGDPVRESFHHPLFVFRREGAGVCHIPMEGHPGAGGVHVLTPRTTRAAGREPHLRSGNGYIIPHFERLVHLSQRVPQERAKCPLATVIPKILAAVKGLEGPQGLEGPEI